MSPESIERARNEEAYLIQLGVPFKPFERVRSFYWPKKGEDQIDVPESYSYVLSLRKKVLCYGMDGVIDVISEDPETWPTTIKEKHPQPLGLAYFRFVYDGKDMEITDQPFILRFTFIVKTPAQYSKLLNSYADVQLGKKHYMLAWNLSMPVVEKEMQKLENGEEVMVVEKNLFDTDEMDPRTLEEIEGGREEFGRITYVWLPDDLKKHRTIKLNFKQFEDGDEEREQISPPHDKERLLLPV